MRVVSRFLCKDGSIGSCMGRLEDLECTFNVGAAQPIAMQPVPWPGPRGVPTAGIPAAVSSRTYSHGDCNGQPIFMLYHSYCDFEFARVLNFKFAIELMHPIAKLRMKLARCS